MTLPGPLLGSKPVNGASERVTIGRWICDAYFSPDRSIPAGAGARTAAAAETYELLFHSAALERARRGEGRFRRRARVRSSTTKVVSGADAGQRAAASR